MVTVCCGVIWKKTCSLSLRPEQLSAVVFRHTCDQCDTGGEEEAQAAFEEAVHAIFTLQLDNHRHTQQYKSKKDGRAKYVMIEMWPLKVSNASCLYLAANPSIAVSWSIASTLV